MDEATRPSRNVRTDRLRYAEAVALLPAHRFALVVRALVLAGRSTIVVGQAGEMAPGSESAGSAGVPNVACGFSGRLVIHG